MMDWGPEIDVRMLGEARDGSLAHALLDVREPREVEICAIAGSLFIPMQQIPVRLAELPCEHPLIIMCHHGSRSDTVAQFLRGNGFSNIHNLAGGIDAWAALMEPGMPRY
jgi:rhodanese-related sulfurtransferase